MIESCKQGFGTPPPNPVQQEVWGPEPPTGSGAESQRGPNSPPHGYAAVVVSRKKLTIRIEVGDSKAPFTPQLDGLRHRPDKIAVPLPFDMYPPLTKFISTFVANLKH